MTSRIGHGTSVGVLLPHFGSASTWDRIFGFAPRLQELGYRSVWVRDQINFQPHGFEDPSSRFLDPFMTLAGIGVLAPELTLGTGSIIPFRHPLVVSQLFGSLAALCGDRIIAGIGVGTPQKSFAAVGMPYGDRWQACRELAHILRLSWSGDHVSYHGNLYEFDDVTIDPRPRADTPIWYAGSSYKAIKRVAEYSDGWLPGRCPFPTLDRGLELLRTAGEEQGRTFGVGIIPVVSIASSREEALEKIDVDALLAAMARRPGFVGSIDTVGDLRGALIAGSPEDCAAEVQEFVNRGIDHLVLDLRLRVEEYEQALEQFAQEVLPLVDWKTGQADTHSTMARQNRKRSGKPSMSNDRASEERSNR
jgi:alkanesulfonate monooxygenase SsuD/methylene tetrahydromethanopterin reductase-like flavin-dependent oxidoreductase (luciferase family)